MLSSVEEVQIAVTPLIGDLADKIVPEDFTAAISQALLELRWSLPLDGAYAYWLIERTKRHVYWILLSTSAHKFRYKDIFLQHRFDQYLKMIKFMDADFKMALETDTELFDSTLYSGLISYISSGFLYDDLGHDHTYDGWL